jgi:hypothetical protein
VTAPVAAETLTWFGVPIAEVTPLLLIVTVPPSETGDPLTPIPVPAETVIEELAKLALVIPAEPDRLEFVSPEIVLDPAVIVAPVIAPAPVIAMVGVFKKLS